MILANRNAYGNDLLGGGGDGIFYDSTLVTRPSQLSLLIRSGRVCLLEHKH